MSAIRPLYHYLQFKKKYGEKRFADLCSKVDETRANIGKPGGPPEWRYQWCYAPSVLTLTMDHIVRRKPLNVEEVSDDDLRQAQFTTTMLTWRTGMGVYRFDPTVFDELWMTELDQELPVEAFERLPEWCPYVEVPEGTAAWGIGVRGFFVWLDDLSIEEGGFPTLMMLPDLENGLLRVPLELPLRRATIYACVLAARAVEPDNREEVEHVTKYARLLFTPLVAVVLYLCSSNAEIMEGGKEARPRRPAVRARYPVLRQPRQWDVAWRMGAALRRAGVERHAPEAGHGTAGTRAPMRPHMRRAHWHSYWIGPRDSPGRELIVKWLPPTAVNVDLDHPAIPTVHPLR